MAVYYKFKSAKDYDSIAIDSHFITVANLKERIFETKHLSRGTDSDLEVTNAQTNEAYADDAMLIPKNTSVLIRRVPARSRMRTVTQANESMPKNKPEDYLSGGSNFISADISGVKDIEPVGWDDDFGNELYAPTPEAAPVLAYNAIQGDPPSCQADEDSKIKALIETPAVDWQHQAAEGFGRGRGFGRGGRRLGGRNYGRDGLVPSIPPPGYVCYRCKVAGHYIQHCPTNGDPAFDNVKRVKPPTGIPMSMLAMNPDGSYALPSGASVEIKPNEAAFEREIEGLPSGRSVGDFPPELHCPLCKQVMRDAVLTSRCCFDSFCDKCIRDYVISKSVCVCGATHVLADDLLPNKTVRDTINRILESANSSGDNARSASQVQDMESARCRPKVASPARSAASKGEDLPLAAINENPKTRETVDVEKSAGPPQPAVQQKFEKLKTAKVPDFSEDVHESASAREPTSQGSAPPVDDVQQKVAAAAEIKKKKKKKTHPAVNAVDMQWRAPQDFGADSFMMPMAPTAYNPYWNGMQPGFQPGYQPGMEGYMGPFGGGMPYNMGCGAGPMDMPFPGVVPHDPFMMQNPMFPMVPPQRDPADYSMGYNARPPWTREQFEARKADLRRKREIEQFGGREMQKDHNHGRDVSSSANTLSMRSKPKPTPSHREPSEERYNHERGRLQDNHHDHHHPSRGGSSGRQMERHSPPPPPPRSRGDTDRLSSKRKSEHLHQSPPKDRHHHHHSRPEQIKKPSSAAGNSQKTTVFARISFRDGEPEPSKKRRPSPEPRNLTKEAAAPPPYPPKDPEYDSSDEDRHFKRKPSRYQPSPPPRQEDARRSTRERDHHSSRHR